VSPPPPRPWWRVPRRIGSRVPATPPHAPPTRPAGRVGRILLDTSEDGFQLKRREFKVLWMSWRVTGLADITRHVIGCLTTHEARVQIAMNDVAGLADVARHVRGCRPAQETRVQSAFDWRGGQYPSDPTRGVKMSRTMVSKSGTSAPYSRGRTVTRTTQEGHWDITWGSGAHYRGLRCPS